MTRSARSLIQERKSVRTFTADTLRAEDKQRLNEYIANVQNPFGVPVTFRILDAKENGLTSPVIVGAEAYLAAKVERRENFEMAFGYSFEKACLFALSLGIGTVMLAASLNRSAFEKAMEVSDTEVMPVASPLGYPAQKRSLRENLMRKGLKADERKPFEKLFFEHSFEQSLTPESAGDLLDALEAVRRAPSATNAQPWRIVKDGETLHFYEAKSMKDSALGDIQKVDIGIALAHFDAVCSEQGITGSYAVNDPAIAAPENTFYMLSFTRER